MNLADALVTFDKVALNLDKLESVWDRAYPHVPTGPSFGTVPEYVSLSRNWDDLLPGLPPIDGWTITSSLPDIAEIGQLHIDCNEIGVLPTLAWEMTEKPSVDLAKYRYLLDKARRRVIASRLAELSDQMTSLIGNAVTSIPSMDEWRETPPHLRERIVIPQSSAIQERLVELERLLGQTVERTGRWDHLYRHLHFGEVHDWHEIATVDWPSVRHDIDAAKIGKTDPIPVPDVDLGDVGKTELAGNATAILNWKSIDAKLFERILFDILTNLDGYQNVELLMNTNAPDRGRDISLERVVSDSSDATRTERTVVQAKHYTSKPVGPIDIQSSLATLSTWEPPVIRFLIIATSSAFSADAVQVIEKHNDNGHRPQIEMWPASKIDRLLSQFPKIAVSYGLRS